MFILNGALFGIWASRIPAVAERHDLGAGELGLLLLLMAAGAIAAFPLAGRAADRFGAHWVTLRVGAAYTLALFLIGLAPSIWTISLALFFFGATHGAMDVAMNAWAGEVERRADRPMMSSFHATFSFGAGAGAGTGFFAAGADLTVAAHFILAGSILSAITFAIAWIDWEPDPSRGGPATPAFVLPKGALFLLGLFAFCSSLGEGAMADWSAIFLVSETGVTEAQAALGYTAFSVAMVLMRLAGDQVIRHLGPVMSARLAGALAATGVITIVMSASYAAAMAGFALLGLGYAVVVPLAFSRAANDPDVAPGAAIASVATLGYGGILLGPPIIGFVAEGTSLRTAFLILLALALLIVTLARVVRPGTAQARSE
ncbi:MAG: MFS transporter [Paracoccaceae bacterium]|nr:MFS transporter [Paracoccaceae bacterium]